MNTLLQNELWCCRLIATNAKSTWSGGLSEVTVSTQMHKTITGCVRVGTLQGFKGLEADVIILVGLDDQATSHPEWLYVGASRAKVALYALFLESTIGLMTTLANRPTHEYG